MKERENVRITRKGRGRRGREGESGWIQPPSSSCTYLLLVLEFPRSDDDPRAHRDAAAHKAGDKDLVERGLKDEVGVVPAVAAHHASALEEGGREDRNGVSLT